MVVDSSVRCGEVCSARAPFSLYVSLCVCVCVFLSPWLGWGCFKIRAVYGIFLRVDGYLSHRDSSQPLPEHTPKEREREKEREKCRAHRLETNVFLIIPLYSVEL